MKKSSAHFPVPESVARKTTWMIVPVILLMYFICYLDRVNISYAALQLNADIGLSDAAYGFGAGIFFVAYVAFQVPANMMLARFGPRRWLGCILGAWGLLAMLMAAITAPWHFFALRFLLGMAEAGFFPAMIYYLALWFPAERRGRITAIAIAAAPLSGLIGGPLSTWLMSSAHGLFGLRGWQSMFVIEALPAVLLGIWCFVKLPERPAAVAWLTAEEKTWLQGTLDAEAEEIQGARRSKGVLRTILSPLVLGLGLVYLALEFGEYALAFFLPKIIERFDTDMGGELSVSQIGLVTAIPSLAGVVAMVLWGRHSDRTRERTWHIAGPAMVGAVAIVAAGYTGSLVAAVLAFSVTAAGIFAAVPIFWQLPLRYLTGTAAAVSIAMINAMGNFSGLLGPSITGVLHDATGSYRAGLWVMGGFLVLAAAGALAVSRMAPVPGHQAPSQSSQTGQADNASAASATS
ncbi:MFS transporter [Streptomyces armeniacus]|uniref:MFS transporter n=1 Tax=Streptomyces armeniacus TaxID=83291 RepID=A0A345XTZ5_9ACTN|nr:MFS transporter [Streptomyces armeniacus]AXK35111.1 MFS transporter [Streptomyces armeniacus]